MRRTTIKRALAGAVSLAVCSLPMQASAIEVTPWLNFNGVVAWTGQCMEMTDDPTQIDGYCGGAFVAQPEISITPTDRDELFMKIGMAAGNGVNDVSPFVLTPWAADLEDDLQDINGRGRDNILTAWYKHTFDLGGETTLGVTGGIIDSTDYLDDVGPANDEFNQFFNEAFVNAPIANLQSYDWGGAAELDSGPFSARFVYMNVGENDDGNEFNFFGGQLAYTMQNSLGQGRILAVVTGTNAEFGKPLTEAEEEEAAEEDEEAEPTSFGSLFSVVLGAEQEVAEFMTLFGRIGWQDEDALVDYSAMYSGGFELKGKLWQREGDKIGFGYSYFEGGNGEIDNTDIFEAYYRMAILENFGVSGDMQYIRDGTADAISPKGWIFGVRTTAEW